MRKTDKFFRPLLIFAFAVACIVVMLEQAGSAEATGLPSSLFESPPPPPPNYVEPGREAVVKDPDTPQISAYIPPGSVDVPGEFRSFFLNQSSDIYEQEPVNFRFAYDDFSTFAAGLWIRGGIDGKATTINQFNHAIILNVEYEEDRIQPEDTERLYMYMYNSAVGGWVKLCTVVDPYEERVSGVVATGMPYEPGRPSLFAVGVDLTSPLRQTVINSGLTILQAPEVPEISLHIRPGTVPVGDSFIITPITNTVSGVIIDYKSCDLHYRQMYKSRQHTEFDQPVTIAIELDEAIRYEPLTVSVIKDYWTYQSNQFTGTVAILDEYQTRAITRPTINIVTWEPGAYGIVVMGTQ